MRLLPVKPPCSSPLPQDPARGDGARIHSDSWGEGLMVAEAHRGDLFAIHSAGAYGQVMAMPYNRRPFAKAYYSDELLK